MTQLELFPLELTDLELARLNALLREISESMNTHEEIFEFDLDSDFAV